VNEMRAQVPSLVST